MLTEDQDQALMAFALEGLDLLGDLLGTERLADRVDIRPPEAAVRAVVGAVAADIQRREQHDPIPVDATFELAGSVEDLLLEIAILRGEQNGGFLDAQRLLVEGLGDYVADLGRFGCRSGRQRFQDILLDEVRRVFTECVVAGNSHVVSKIRRGAAGAAPQFSSTWLPCVVGRRANRQGLRRWFARWMRCAP
jgi:hypothetical protein